MQCGNLHPATNLRDRLGSSAFLAGTITRRRSASVSSTNASGIIDEVKKICTAQPTMRLREATKEAHGNIWDREAKSRERK